MVSAFLVAHLSALAVWNLDPCAVRSRFERCAGCYLLPLGLWQEWGMFAPEPFRGVPTLEADLRDARGGCRHFSFPSLADRRPWRTVGEHRHPKFAHNAMTEENPGYREFAARHVVRQL